MLDYLPHDLVLRGEHVSLEPLQKSHRDELLSAAADGALWQLKVTTVPSESELDSFLQTAIENRLLKIEHPFVVRRLADNKVVGSTRYYEIDPRNRNLSIGHTWYAKSAQRSAVNSECKLLLLAHAFERLACQAVYFHTHHENIASQKAIERIGAKRDGLIRNHRIMRDGSKRHTVCYSIIDEEWPDLRNRLEERLLAG